jgi:DNA adenine methylase
MAVEQDVTAVETSMLIGAITPWFGGKRTLAPAIVEQLGKHRAYWELFCGPAAVLFAKPRSPFEAINDLHGDLINLVRVVASDRAQELMDRCQRTLFAEPLFYELSDIARGECPPAASSVTEISDQQLVRAWTYLTTSWMGMNGVAGLERDNFSMALRWTPGGGSGGKRWDSVTGSLMAWHSRLQGVQITQRDAFSLVEQVSDEPGVVLYVDPPYLPETRQNFRNNQYRHEFSDGNPMFGVRGDHERLHTALGRFRKARVVISYYDHPRIRELYAGWTFVEKTMNKNLKSQGGRGAGRAEDALEVLIINGESYAKGAA